MPEQRIEQHGTESKSKRIFENAVCRFSLNSLHMREEDVIFREVTERDYGVDGEIELFNYGRITGRIAYIQLKGTERSIQKLKTVDAVSCKGISKSNLSYCRQQNVPVMLVYVSTKDKDFYYIDLQSIYQGKIEDIGDKNSGTVRIPVANHSNNLEHFFEIINDYYDRFETESSHPKIEAGRKNMIIPELSADYNFLDDKEKVNDKGQVTSYEFEVHCTPSDGEHEQVDSISNTTVAVGLYKNGELISGTEYNWLIKVIQGKLIYKPNCPNDPYGATDDFKYEKPELYGWDSLSPFSWSDNEIEYTGIDYFYVVDMKVSDGMEELFNIRTLREFFQEKAPQKLEYYEAIRLIENEE